MKAAPVGNVNEAHRGPVRVPALKNHRTILQEEARAAVAAPVERIADSLDEQAEEPERGGGGRLDKAVKGEFGEYDFDDAQLKVRLEEFYVRKGDRF